jgi:hypothetical protein
MFNVHLPENYPCQILNYTSVSDLHSLKNCISKIKRIERNSSSMSEIFRLTKKNNENVFMKLFISEMPEVKSLNVKFKDSEGKVVDFTYDNNSLKNNISDLVYEQYIYFNFINKLSEFEICPFFIRMIGSQKNVNIFDILNFLENKLVDSEENIISKNIIDKSFIKNLSSIIYFLGGMGNFMGEGDFLPLTSTKYPDEYPKEFKFLSLKEYSKIRFDYIITETIKNEMNLNTFLKNVLKICRKKNFNLKEKFCPLVMYIFLQVLLSCKILDLSKINHNDLHFGNILIKTIKNSNNFICNFKNDIIKKYKFNYPILIKIYDFDLSYYFGNKKNTNLDMKESKSFRSVKQTSQIKMLLGKFIYYMYNIPETYEFSENEKKDYYDFFNLNIVPNIIKKTKFKLYLSSNEYNEYNEKELDIKTDKNNNKFIEVNETEKYKVFDFIQKLYIFYNMDDFTDSSIDSAFYKLEDMIDNIYNNKRFYNFNKHNSMNKSINYYITKNMFDSNGNLIISKMNEFRCNN